MTDSIEILPLKDCLQRLKRINHTIKAPKEVAHLYTAALGLFCHLKKEQAVLYSKAKASEPCPSHEELPAMTAVLSDPRLVASLLRCLKSPPPEAEGAERRNHPRTSSNAGASSMLTGRGGGIIASMRKRGMSFSDDGPSSKLAKTGAAMSPMMSSISKQKVSIDNFEASLPVQAIAASIFYASLQHLNHWPAPLMHAYAEDSFGPRLWVDQKECQLLVANLRLAHGGCTCDVPQSSKEVLLEAQQVASFYANMMLNIPPEESAPKPFRTSFTSLSRSTSLTRQASEEPSFPEDSDSGEEEIVEVSMGTVVTSSTTGGGGDDSSSSGDEEIVLTSATSFDQGKAEPDMDLYPLQPQQINLTRIRPRYFGANAQLGFDGVSSALERRLEQKSKQNSRLLQTLPDFTSIPGVRCLIANSLEKWLQSPALSGAARSLFSSTVQQLKECDPPLPKDLETIDAILNMQLKANQLNMHIENVTEIAKRIPTPTVSRHLFVKILRKEMESMDNASPNSEQLQMISAVHGALSKDLRNEGLAAAILTLLVETPPSKQAVPTRRERNKLVRKILLLLQRLFASLGSMYFDGCGLVESLLSFDFNTPNWTARDEEDKARIMLECIALHVPSVPEDPALARGKSMKKFARADSQNGISSEEMAKLKKNLVIARKLFITWCVMDYAPLWQMERVSNSSGRKKHDSMIGAGPTEFGSILDDESTISDSSKCPNAMKCILFMVDPESQEMQDFLYPEGPPQAGSAAYTEEMHRIRQCYLYGADLDNKMVSIVLASVSNTEGGIKPLLALSLIEHLFQCCRKGRNADLKVTDPKLVWEMYKLVEYHPLTRPKISLMASSESQVAQNDQFADADDDMDVDAPATNGKANDEADGSFPRLARPGLWWRVTSLALIMTGSSPDGIGAVIANDHPTLRELIKMVTSTRYRFPTVDCDDARRDIMKKGETEMRNKESRAAELLFLPPLKKESNTVQKNAFPHGSRVSIRQRQRQERALREEREKEAANAQALASKRKRLLKAAQKTIMIWDPHCPARKPPRESVNLILSVERMFGLSETYQKSVKPDLIQAAIGDTSRGAIERAYDWLIPVISAIPSVINRLPASASCFLLLRVYGTESDGNSELRELSAPLLQHVHETVTGCFGQEDAIGAVNLLLTDVAEKKPARRRCARRVLQETLSELNKTIEDKSFDEAKCTWLRSLLLLDHIALLLPDAIKHISDALSRERGRVLRAMVLSLDQYIKCAREKGISGDWNFASSLCDLISTRHLACSEAMGRFPDLGELAISVVHKRFIQQLMAKDAEVTDGDSIVELVPCHLYMEGKLGPSRLPHSLLLSACVLLSIWKETDEGADSSRELVNELANILMHPYDTPESLLKEADGIEGVASATIVDTDKPAVSVDEWVMLAKSRSDYIARRAALSAPAKFLPRLLLCSGLPKASLLTMIDRLGKLGEKSESAEKTYRELLMPSVATDWGFGQIGTRREIARKLIGRLSAYISMGGDSLEELSEDICFNFIAWLSRECQPPERPRKGRPLKKAMKAGLASNTASQMADAELLLSKVVESDDMESDSLLKLVSPSLESFKSGSAAIRKSPAELTDSNLKQFIMDCCATSDTDTLEFWIESTFFSVQPNPPRTKGSECADQAIKTEDVAVLLLESCVVSHTNSEWNRAVERWIPPLSRIDGSPKLWRALFSQQEFEVNIECIVTSCCKSWCPSKSMECGDWILASRDIWETLDVQRAVAFILHTSGQRTPHTSPFQRIDWPHHPWFEQKETVDSIVLLSFECAKRGGQLTVERNDIAGWLHLLLLVAQTGKGEANHMIGTILHGVDEAKNNDLRMLMAEATLRIYSYFPFYVSLGNPKLRTLLVDACKKIDWRSWRTPLDGALNDMLSGLNLSPNPRLVHGLVDVSKTHPLILLRKLDQMSGILDNDALADVRRWSRVRVQGENIEGPVIGVFNKVEFKVSIRHWGYSYTEPLWISFIDVLLSVPREVLFSCGMGMGLERLLAVYIKLLFVQSTLREKAARLKARFADLVKTFPKDTLWNKWLSSPVSGLDSQSKVRTVLVRCNLITADQAIENLKSNESEK